MICNCHIILRQSDPVAATVEARNRLAKDIHPSRDPDAAPLFRAPEVVKEGWGYPERVVVTFAPAVRDWHLPKGAE